MTVYTISQHGVLPMRSARRDDDPAYEMLEALLEALLEVRRQAVEDFCRGRIIITRTPKREYL